MEKIIEKQVLDHLIRLNKIYWDESYQPANDIRHAEKLIEDEKELRRLVVEQAFGDDKRFLSLGWLITGLNIFGATPEQIYQLFRDLGFTLEE